MYCGERERVGADGCSRSDNDGKLVGANGVGGGGEDGKRCLSECRCGACKKEAVGIPDSD